MIHHRRVTSGYSSTPAAGGRNIGSTGAGRPPTGGEYDGTPADATAALVDELVGDMPLTAAMPLPSDRRWCGLPRSKGKGMLGKVAFVATTGTGLAILNARRRHAPGSCKVKIRRTYDVQAREE